MPKTSGVIRWDDSEKRNVALAAAQLMKSGHGLTDAVRQGQMVLPRDRRHAVTTIATGNFQRRMRDALVKHAKLTVEESKVKQKRGTPIRWTFEEWALIARRVKYWRDTLNDKRTTARIVFDAAAIELPPERQRGFASVSAHTIAETEGFLKAGSKNVPLVASIAFDPNRESFREPSAGSVFEFIDDTKVPQPTAQAPQRPQAASKPLAPPSTPAQAPSAPQPAATADAPQGITFSVTLPPAGVELMRGMIAQAVANELDARIPVALVKITGHLQSSIAQMLTTFLDAKPGDTVPAPPPPPAPPETHAPAAQAIREVKLPLLDVVGLIGPQINQVKDTLNGYASSVRFIDADHVDSWKPRPVVILNTKFIGHNAEHRCKKANVKPIRVHGGADAVLRALNDLFMQQAGAVSVPMQH